MPRFALSFYHKYKKIISENPNFTFDEAYEEYDKVKGSVFCGKKTAKIIIDVLNHSLISDSDNGEIDYSNIATTNTESYEKIENDMYLEYIYNKLKTILVKENQLDIFWLRFVVGLKLRSIGEIYGLSRERIRQVAANSMSSLRSAIRQKKIEL